VITKPRKAETTGGIIGDLFMMDGRRSTRALAQDEDVRGKSQERNALPPSDDMQFRLGQIDA
jgi:hypothetical protein